MNRFLPLLLLAATPALAADGKDLPEHGTRLDIVATGEVQRAPDVATIGAGVVTQATQAGAAMASNAERMTATVAALRKAGVADRDIQTSQVSLQPQYRYGENQPPVLTGYQVSNRVTVRLRDLRNAGRVLDALVAAGANQIDGPTFGVDKPEAALDEARTQAIATARSRAELYAKAAGLRVVRIARISESGQVESPIRPMAVMAMRKAADTPVEAGEQALSVTVSVSFELGQ
jgi:uncharacterized protein YggE